MNAQGGTIVRIWAVLFIWLISRTFSANKQYFSFTTNQSTVLLAITYQPNEQGIMPVTAWTGTALS